MSLSLRTQLDVFTYILRQKIRGADRYPLVLMLEPLFACNLSCGGCGKIQYPPDILKKRMSPEACWAAAEECGAPIVSIAGGEPLAHKDMPRIVEGLIERKKTVYLCTNALLLGRSLPEFKPSPRLIFSVHLDGREKTHDRAVCRKGVHKTAVAAIRKAKAAGFTVMTNTTVFQGEPPEELRAFFEECADLGIDGMMLSPGYAYDKAKEKEIFLKNEQTRSWFRKALDGWRKKGWPINHSPFYLDFLEGKRDYDCTPWGNPVYTIFGWQRPCYLLSDGGYVRSYQELIEGTDWSRYGRKSKNPKCAQCMAHVGYEPSAVADMFSGPGKFLEMLLDIATIRKPRKPGRPPVEPSVEAPSEDAPSEEKTPEPAAGGQTR